MAAECSERIDGVAQVLMRLIADLEQRELLDGDRFCRGLRGTAALRRTDGLATSARTIGQIADQLDAARQARQ